MKTITYYEIEFSTYQDEIVGSIQYEHSGEVVRSQRYSLAEINNILELWRIGELKGSFGIGTVLAKDAKAVLFQRG